MTLKKLEKQYSPHQRMPFAGYAALTLVFNALLFGVMKRRARSVKLFDLFLTGVATHKLARIITKDEVTSFIRAPFTRYQESLGYGEVNEEVRQPGDLQVIGELLSCNYCMSAWVALGFFWGWSRFPRETRTLSGFFSVIAISDFLHVLYEERRTHANVLTLQEEERDHKRSSAA
jgi:hypothetical protein